MDRQATEQKASRILTIYPKKPAIYTEYTREAVDANSQKKKDEAKKDEAGQEQIDD